MTSSGQNQSEINSEKTAANVKTVERDYCCTYPNERRERNQIYTLLSISNCTNEQEEKTFECVNGTGWEEAVQGWSKTAPFSYLQLQKRARKTRTSESVGGCLYCLDMMQLIDKSFEQDPKLSASVTTDSIPEKQNLLYSYTALSSYPGVDDSKKDNCNSKFYSTQTSQGEKKRLPLKEAQFFLSEKKAFLMKESQLLQAEKKAVPIREYSILSFGKPKGTETLKHKDTKSHELVLGNLGDSEANPVKSSMVLPPLKDTALKNGLDLSPKKSKPVIFQANEKASCALSETISRTQVFKTKEPCPVKGIDQTGDALKEPIKIDKMASFAPKLPKTSYISGITDQCYWRCALLPNRKITPISNSIALRRKTHLSSMHFLHMKGACGSKADENWDLCTRSHTGPRQRNESNTQEIPLLSGLFPSLTDHGWGRATPFACCKRRLKPKNPRISKTVSKVSHTSKAPVAKGNLACITQPDRAQAHIYLKFAEGETVSSCKKLEASYIKRNNIPVMTAHPEGERMNRRLDSIRTFLGEKRTFPMKEYEIKYSQGDTKPAVLKCSKTQLPGIICSDPPSDFRYPTLNALLVLKMDGKGIVNLHLEPPSKKNETIPGKRTEKGGSTLAETALHSHQIKKGKQKSKRNVGVMNNKATKQIKNNIPPFHVSLTLALPF